MSTSLDYCPHGIHWDNACGACIPPRGTRCAQPASPPSAEATVNENRAREIIVGAVARGWCHPKNSSKTVDTDLGYAIVDEVIAVLNADMIARSSASGAEPVVWVDPDTLSRLNPGGIVVATLSGGQTNRFTFPLYTSPVARQPLTKEKIDEISGKFRFGWDDHQEFCDLVQAIERAHGIVARSQAGDAA